MRNFSISLHRPTINSGFSLVSCIIGIAVLAILARVMATSFKSNLNVSKDIAAKGNLEDIRKTVRIGMDCARTVSALPSPCAAGTNIAVMKRTTTTPLIIKPTTTLYTTIGGIRLRASCTSTPNVFKFEAETKNSNETTATWKNMFTTPVSCQ